MDERIRELQRLAAHGDIEARTELAYRELRLLGDRPDVNAYREIVYLLDARALQSSWTWLGGSWDYRGVDYPAFINLDVSSSYKDYIKAYLSMRSLQNTNTFTFVEMGGCSDTDPENIIQTFSGYGPGHVYGISLLGREFGPKPRVRDYNRIKRAWIAHPEVMLNAMADAIAEMDKIEKAEAKRRARAARRP